MSDIVLDLDVGNSYTKWRTGTQRGSVVTGELPALEQSVARVRVSAVAHSENLLSQQIQGMYHVQPEFAKTSKTLLGVHNGYDDISQLGVDRWLALVAAWHRVQSDLIVFDLGTAMTADYVRADGNHLGGYIVPGLNAMRNALGQRTRDVRVHESASDVMLGGVPATNTGDAVNFGLGRVQIGWIKSCIVVGTQSFSNSPTLILTGGDLAVKDLSQLFRFQYFPDLVLEGLALALP
ncbi:MAG: type III pantothenate kinase [Gammaproteobacteria bacterium]|nr:type III pantothenate kinase [Gammaproteobacteria bacterium]